MTVGPEVVNLGSFSHLLGPAVGERAGVGCIYQRYLTGREEEI